MTASHELHIRIDQTPDTSSATCTKCGQQIAYAITPNPSDAKKLFSLAWIAALAHHCATKEARK